MDSVPISVLDLSWVREGDGPAEALRNTLALAQHVELLGFHRFWLAEHHNMEGIASAATSVVIGYVAGGTSSIRVGSGGIMLPNHAPLMVAEQFGTLATLYPGRIDLGVGRAPGTDPLTARALRRALSGGADSFPEDVMELRDYLWSEELTKVRAVPGSGTRVPMWILGSSDFGARLAGQLGLPFAFASHFAPDYLYTALELYRAEFRPSEQLSKPYAMVAVNVVAAGTDEEALRLFTSPLQQFLRMVRGTRGKLPPPVDALDWSDAERAAVERMIRFSVVGSPSVVKEGIEGIVRDTGANEIIATGGIYDFGARLRSFEILSELIPTPAKV